MCPSFTACPICWSSGSKLPRSSPLASESFSIIASMSAFGGSDTTVTCLPVRRPNSRRTSTVSPFSSSVQEIGRPWPIVTASATRPRFFERPGVIGKRALSGVHGWAPPIGTSVSPNHTPSGSARGIEASETDSRSAPQISTSASRAGFSRLRPILESSESSSARVTAFSNGCRPRSSISRSMNEVNSRGVSGDTPVPLSFWRSRSAMKRETAFSTSAGLVRRRSTTATGVAPAGASAFGAFAAPFALAVLTCFAAGVAVGAE